jgi:hypothetical protein
VGEQVEPDSVELARLREELRSCRLELAARHRELETLHEERHEILRRCEAAEEQARLLSAKLDQRLTESDEPASSRLLRGRARK